MLESEISSVYTRETPSDDKIVCCVPHFAGTGHRRLMIRSYMISLLLLVGLVLTGCSRAPVEIRLLTPTLPLDRQIVLGLRETLEDSPYFRLELVAQSDPEQNPLDLLAGGAADLALVANNESYRSGIETVIPLYSTVLHIAFQKALEPLVVSDLLVGRTVFAGPPGSPSRVLLRQTSDRLGVDPQTIRFVDALEPRPDVIVLFTPVKPGLMDDFLDYRLFSIGSVDQLGRGSQVEALTLMHPQLRPFVLPRDTYPGVVDSPVVTVAVDKLLVARSDVSSALIYDLISELIRLKPALSVSYPGLFHDLTGDFDASGSSFALHQGAQAYVERDAPSIYERYSGVAEVLVTLLIGVMSGSFAILKLYRIRRKNRIDGFYARAIAIRKSSDGNASDAARVRALEEVRGLQEEAFELLASEKLAADDSFRIFITLSNDIISDLGGRSSTPSGSVG
jgi:TRAP-type uncharacterized transport system substrate-binding protein